MGFKRRLRETEICAQCGKEFIKRNYNQKFCTPECRNNHFNDIKHEAMELYKKQNQSLVKTYTNMPVPTTPTANPASVPIVIPVHEVR